MEEKKLKMVAYKSLQLASRRQMILQDHVSRKVRS